MRDISTELKVGITVIIAGAILVFGIIWVKNYRFNIQRYNYSVLFPNIGSLEVGDPVSVLGVKKGEVKKIALVGDNVLVTFNLTKDVVLQSDARFTVMNVGLMGERFINIRPGVSPDRLNLTQAVHGYYDTGIPEVMGMMGAAIDEVRHLVAILQGTIATPAFTASITDVVNNLQKITTDWQTLTAESKNKMIQTIDNLSVSASKLSGLIDTNEEKVRATITNLNEGSEKFAMLAGRLDTLSSSVHDVISELQEGKGTVGRALKNDSLYNQLLSASTNLDSLIGDFKKHPKKYIHFSVF